MRPDALCSARGVTIARDAVGQDHGRLFDGELADAPSPGELDESDAYELMHLLGIQS